MKHLAVILLSFVFIISCKKKLIVTDIDGNIYQTVTIGEQTWMKENLKTTRYSNGDTIFFSKDTIPNLSRIGMYYSYNNDTNYKKKYGLLYNWFAVKDTRGICPKGWHVPKVSEWDTLISFLGGDSLATIKLKDTSYLLSPQMKYKATNESGFCNSQYKNVSIN